MRENLVSVVIPTYNCGPLLKRAIQSVIDQTHSEWEIIVIDNHSADNTDQVIEGFDGHRITHIKVHNFGVIAHSRNHGLRLAQGEWIAFLDADDWWKPKKIETCLKALKSGADIVYHDLEKAGKKRKIFSRGSVLSRNLSTPVFKDLVERGNAIPNSSVVVRRAILEQVGSLSENPNLVGGEDLEYWIRIAKVTEKFQKIEGKLGYYWIGNANTLSPRKIITCLSELRSNHFGMSTPERSPIWVAFAIAKANFLLGKNDQALFELRNVQFKREQWRFFFRRIALTILIYINSRFGFDSKKLIN